ncbi:unnamed protein product [Effrenium voratum]|nr:unnamed protein product [Effrenium voratum]
MCLMACAATPEQLSLGCHRPGRHSDFGWLNLRFDNIRLLCWMDCTGLGVAGRASYVGLGSEDRVESAQRVGCATVAAKFAFPFLFKCSGAVDRQLCRSTSTAPWLGLWHSVSKRPCSEAGCKLACSALAFIAPCVA